MLKKPDNYNGASLDDIINRMDKNPKIDGAVLDQFKQNTFSIKKLLSMINEKTPYVIICLLDCCRVYISRDPNLNKMVARGPELASETLDDKGDDTAGYFIGFACQPGTKAYDIKQQRNGLFTKYLKTHIATPKTDIRIVFGAITKAVRNESREQTPQQIGTLTEEIYLCDQPLGMYLILQSNA